MCRRLGIYALASLLVAHAVPVRAARAQYCIGATEYLVRDERGGVMGPEQMRRLVINDVNGVPLRLRASESADGPPEYVYDAFDVVRRDTVAVQFATLSNPLGFRVPCGQIGDLTLRYGGREMRLLFDVREHNTHYEIDSPPFQEGTFHLRRLRCADGAAPPMIDNNTTGKCRVAADNWEGMDREWVRHVLPVGSNGGSIDPSSAAQCRTGAVETITTPPDWVTAWSTHPSVARGNPLPTVDFRTQFVLVVYLAGQRPTYSFTSIEVDKRGDLTFVPAPRDPVHDPPQACSLLFLTLYRSGISSIGGRPLPPPAAR